MLDKMGHSDNAMTPAERFWSKTAIEGTCIVWTGALVGTKKDPRGYAWNGKRPQLAHRLITERITGPIPAGKVVMHTCDNGRCVKPQHLDIGTQLQNIRDASKKNRLIGNRTNTARYWKIPPDQVEVIVARKARGDRAVDIARDYGVTFQTIYHILKFGRKG